MVASHGNYNIWSIYGQPWLKGEVCFKLFVSEMWLDSTSMKDFSRISHPSCLQFCIKSCRHQSSQFIYPNELLYQQYVFIPYVFWMSITENSLILGSLQKWFPTLSSLFILIIKIIYIYIYICQYHT